MSSLQELCEEHFGTSDIYGVLGIDSKASEKEGEFVISLACHFPPIQTLHGALVKFDAFCFSVKNAYRKMSLKIHPDRVEESEKKICTEKFQILGRIHAILSDTEKRSVYDRTGTRLMLCYWVLVVT
jgi:DnaJ homolog subfamily C member 9